MLKINNDRLKTVMNECSNCRDSEGSQKEHSSLKVLGAAVEADPKHNGSGRDADSSACSNQVNILLLFSNAGRARTCCSQLEPVLYAGVKTDFPVAIQWGRKGFQLIQRLAAADYKAPKGLERSLLASEI